MGDGPWVLCARTPDRARMELLVRCAPSQRHRAKDFTVTSTANALVVTGGAPSRRYGCLGSSFWRDERGDRASASRAMSAALRVGARPPFVLRDDLVCVCGSATRDAILSAR